MKKFWEYLRDIWDTMFEHLVSDLWGLILSAIALGAIVAISSVLVEC